MAVGLLIDIKKYLIWILLLGAGFSLFAQVSSNASIFIPPVTGIGKTQNDNTVIAQMLTNEIKARHGTLGESVQKADFILYGTLAPYHEEQQQYHDYVFLNAEDSSADITTYTYNSMLRTSSEQVYIFQLILKNRKANKAILLQNILYLSIEDVYDFFPLLIYNMYSQTNVKYTPVKNTSTKQVYADTEDWRNKWLYLRVSLDLPITRYILQPKGLYKGHSVWTGDPGNSSTFRAQQLENKIIILPGMTLGAEAQLLNWLSIEPNIQLDWEYLNDQNFINVIAGLELKFPLKFIGNIMLEPYGAVSSPVKTSSTNVFNKLPTIAFGGGLQLGMKGWKETGVFFIDINYMYSPSDAIIRNPYGSRYEYPSVVYYQRSVLGLGVGYKFGIINRK